MPETQSAELTWLDRLQAIIEILLLSGLISGFFAILPFSLTLKGSATIMRDAQTVALYLLLESWITLVLLFIVMRVRRETPGDIGLHARRWLSQFAVGAGIVPALFMLNAVVNTAFRTLLPKYYIDRNPLTDLIRTPQDVALFLLSALIAGGIKEELQRAFILTRFRRYLGGAGLGLLLWSLAFGAGHYVQGPQGMVSATLFGMMFGAVYLARGSLLAPIAAHSLYDVAAILVYWFTEAK